MAIHVTTALSFAATALASGLAYYYWRRSSGLYALLLEGANRYEELRQRGSQIEATLQKNEQKATKDRENFQKMEKTLHEAHAKNGALVQDLETKNHEVTLVRERLETQRGHLERHLLKITHDLKETTEAKGQLEQRLTGEIHELTTRLRNVQKDSAQTITALQVELSLRDKDISLRVKDLEKEKSAVEKRAKLMDPLELKRLKRKLAGYERLYSSMKGLREMTDERNRNWEVALKKLAAYIVGAKHGGKISVPEAIGPLVGEALELIGAQLLDESVDFTAVHDSAAAKKADAEIAELEAENEAGTQPKSSVAPLQRAPSSLESHG